MFKKILAFFVGIALVIPMVSFPSVVSAAAGSAVRFQIEAPTVARVGEAIDVTVRALNKDGQVATDYRGSMVFTTDWMGDVFPMPSRSIVFTDEDNGEKKFSKGVIFKRSGKQKLYATDLTDDISGEATVTVEEGSSTSLESTEDVTILTPTADTKVVGSTLTVSGKARKNSRITINLNGTDVATVTSDDSGIFSKEIQAASQETNVIKASLLDANNNVVSTSSEVKFQKANSGSSIYGVTLSPDSTVQASSDVTITVEAEKWLSEVTVMLDGSSYTLKEVSEGKYSLQTKAPQKEGSYPIGVSAKTVANQTVTQDNMATLKVEPKKEETPTVVAPVVKPAFKDIKTTTQADRVNFSFEVENPPANLSTFKITYGNTGSVVTYTVDKILKDGKYQWYIDKLAAGDYTFKIYGQKADSWIIDGLTSEAIPATIGVQSCTISNVGKITIKTDTSKSVLSWDPVKDAAAYNVYRIDESGKYTLVTKVTQPSYTLYLSKGAVTYGDFAVKAVCGDNTESGDYSNASKVQTGPGTIAFVVIISGIFAAAILRRRAS